MENYWSQGNMLKTALLPTGVNADPNDVSTMAIKHSSCDLCGTNIGNISYIRLQVECGAVLPGAANLINELHYLITTLPTQSAYNIHI
jgi:hypothetical protein